MAKIGRNDPCPCGSGKKCCAGHAEPAQARPPELARERETLSQRLAALPAERVLDEDDARLDELSNSIVDLVAQKRFDEALARCKQLLRDYPEVIDGLERSALVHEAREEWALAAELYRRALAFTEQPEQQDGFDEEGRAYFRSKIADLEARTAAHRPAPDAT